MGLVAPKTFKHMFDGRADHTWSSHVAVDVRPGQLEAHGARVSALWHRHLCWFVALECQAALNFVRHPATRWLPVAVRKLVQHPSEKTNFANKVILEIPVVDWRFHSDVQIAIHNQWVTGVLAPIRKRNAKGLVDCSRHTAR